MAKSKLPPTDKNGETKSAMLILDRMRKHLTGPARKDEQPLPLEWQHWVADQVKAGLPDVPAE